MHLNNLRGVTTLTCTLLAALVLVSSDTARRANEDSPITTKENQRETKRKYLELEDLNTFESPVASALLSEDVGSEEAFEGYVSKNVRPHKLVRREVSEKKETKPQQTRTGRQSAPKKQRPGILWTIARVTYETFNDTRSAIQQIGQIINEAIPADPPKKKPASSSLKKPIAGAKPSGKAVDVTGTTTQAPVTTTEFRLTRPLLQSLVRRNVKGLVRLFNIEWRDAMNQSKQNIQDFRRDLGKQLSIYLQDNPDNY